MRRRDEGELRIGLLDCDCSSYLDDPEITARIFRDGWFHPGDLAVRRPDGRIRLLGRVADVLNIGGSKFAVGPIQQHVQEVLGVASVCLFGRLDDAGNDELVVAFEAARDPSSDRLERIAAEFRTFTQVRFRVSANFRAWPKPCRRSTDRNCGAPSSIREKTGRAARKGEVPHVGRM